MKMQKYPKVKRVGDEAVSGLLVDGTRVHIQEKMDGCLPYSQRVQTKEGAVPIGEIVNNEQDVEVLSYDTESGELEYCDVVGYCKNGRGDKWLKIYHDGESKGSSVTLTPNHEVYTPSGKVQAGDISVGDELVTPRPKITGQLHDLVVGSLLGDASLGSVGKSRNCHLSETHGEGQHEYVEWKASLFGELHQNSRTYKGAYDDSCPETTKKSMSTNALPAFSHFEDKFYPRGEKRILEDIELNERIVAIWFCDDGSTSYSDVQRPRTSFHTQGFTNSDVNRLVSALSDMGIDCSAKDYGKGPQIDVTTEGSEALYQAIAPYIPKCMEYKIPDKFWVEGTVWDIATQDREKVSVTEIEEVSPINKQKYDIEVEKNHNYFTKGVLVSNSNFRFMLDEHLDEEYQTEDRDLVFGSRNVVYKNEKDVAGAFEHAVEYVRGNIDIQAFRGLDFLEGGVVCYGEAMHPHTLEYDWGSVPSFLGFDVYADGYGFLDPMDVPVAFDEIGLDAAPFIGVRDAGEIDADFEIPDSEYRDGIAEGVIFRNLRNGTKAKLRSEQFLEKHGSSPDKPEVVTDAQRFVATYITEHRIEKTALKLVDEGEWSGLQMEMMEDLPRRVLVDALEEEAWDVLTQSWELDMDDVRSEGASKCASVLRDVMRNGSPASEP